MHRSQTTRQARCFGSFGRLWATMVGPSFLGHERCLRKRGEEKGYERAEASEVAKACLDHAEDVLRRVTKGVTHTLCSRVRGEVRVMSGESSGEWRMHAEFGTPPALPS